MLCIKNHDLHLGLGLGTYYACCVCQCVGHPSLLANVTSNVVVQVLRIRDVSAPALTSYPVQAVKEAFKLVLGRRHITAGGILSLRQSELVAPS